MSVPASLLPELEDVVQHGSAEKRAETLRRITGLFLDGAQNFHAEHIALFDDVIGCLIEEIEAKALAELARRIAPVVNAPAGVVSSLAKNDDIAVAGPILKQARIADRDLMYIAENKSQAHLLAMSTRQRINEALSDILVERGDREVVRSIANNRHAQLSDNAFSTLVKRAEEDSVLAEKVGMRTDIPPRLFRQLLMRASDVVQKRLLAKAKPETQTEIRRVLAQVTDEVAAKAAPRNYAAALATVRALHSQHKLKETDIAEFAKSGKYQETIAARASGFDWSTVKAILNARPGAKPSPHALDVARDNFERLTVTTAQRVVRFWQVRQGTGD